MKAGPLRHFAGLRLLAALLPVALTACASLGGAPMRVVGVRQSVNLAQRYSVDDALRAFHDNPTKSEVATEDADLRRGLNPQQYRDMVVSVYLNAIDARYFEFKTALSGERRELGTGFDFAILGLTTAASVARDSIVNSLSAAASVMTGTRSSIDRNLYFDQTLPGLLAAMEAARLRVLTRITENLAKSDVEYPLETAFADLNTYEMAASLDGAIGQITATASAERQEAQDLLNAAVQACEPEANAVDLNARLSEFVEDLANPQLVTATDTLAARTASLRQIAEMMDLPRPLLIAEPSAILTAINSRLLAGVNGRCSTEQLQSLIARIEQTTRRQVPQ